jgi:S1-C subfamily serine protease
MRRTNFAFWIATSLLAVLPAQVASAQSFRNCATLKAKYSNGVAINFGVIGTSGAEINRTVYLRNQRLDRDKDGIICEDEWAQSLSATTTTTTTTTLPVTRKTPISDLSAFIRSFGSALTTIECKSGGNISVGSGTSVSVSFSQDQINQGIRSILVTNHHVVKNCLRSGDWLNRQVLVRAAAADCVGYVWSYREDKDLATVFTTCDIPKVAGFTGFTVPKPEIGDVAIIIGSAAGLAGTSTQGAIANIMDKEILTTAQAAPGSSGGALFNRDGQLLGIVQAGTGSLTVVIPITRFPGAVYGDTTIIGWRS